MITVSVRLPKEAMQIIRSYGHPDDVISYFLENWCYDIAPESYGPRTDDSQYSIHINSPAYEKARLYYSPNSSYISVRRIILNSIYNSTVLYDYKKPIDSAVYNTRLGRLLDVKTELLRLARFDKILIDAVDIVDTAIHNLHKEVISNGR